MTSTLRTHPITVARHGRAVAVGFQAEVLAYNTADEGPLWTATCGSEVVGLLASGAHCIAVEADGTLRGLDAATGAEAWVLAPDGAVLAFEASCDGALWAAASETSVRVGQGGRVVRTVSLERPGPCAVAFAGETVVVGYEDGEVVYCPEGEAPVTRPCFEGLMDMASEPNSVLVTASTKLSRIFLEGKGQGLVEYGDPLTGVTRSPNGSLYAIRVGQSAVVMFAMSDNEDVGMVRYLDREAGGFAIDPQGNLWVACGLGHANKLDATLGSAVMRTDEHPGYERGSWMVSISGHADTPGSPRDAVMAERAAHAPAASASSAANTDADDDDTPGWLKAVISIVATVVVLGLWWGLIKLLE